MRPPYILWLAWPLLLALSACETIPVVETEETPTADTEDAPSVAENPDITQARAALVAARSIHAEWLVHEPRISEFPVSLSDILRFAEKMQEDGRANLASELARKVTRMSNLGIEQITSQPNVAPYYPQ